MKKSNLLFIVLFFSLPIYLLANDLQVTKGVSPAKDSKCPVGIQIPLVVEIYNAIGPPLPANSWYLGFYIKNQAGQLMYSGSLDGPALGQGEKKQITFPNKFTPTGSETFNIVYYLDFQSDINTSNNSVEYNFSSYGKPNKPIVKSPADGATGIIPNPPPLITFEQESSGGVLPPVSQTLVYIGPTLESISPNSGVAITSSIHELKSYTYPWPLEANQTYYLAIEYANAAGSNRSSNYSFITGQTNYQKASLITPANNSKEVPTNPVILYWSNPPNATSIDVYIGTTNESVTPNVGAPYSQTLSPNISEFTLPSNYLAKNKNYMWRIIEKYASTYSMSNIYTFTTGNTWYPNPPDILSPHDGETNVPTNILIKTDAIKEKRDDHYNLAIYLGPTIESVCPDQGVPVSQAMDVYSVTYNPPANFIPNIDYYTRTAIFPNTGSSGSLLKSGALYFPGKRIQFRTGAGPVSIFENPFLIPDDFILSQNYPNPFNPTTKIKFGIPSSKDNKTRHVELTIFDLTGKQVDQLLNEDMNPGSYEVEFNGKHLSSGIYFYRLKAGSFTKSVKMVLLK